MMSVQNRSPQRREIHALRALAVLLVIAYHLWPGAMRAGFIGVDVFFVISGFLITAQLLKELRTTGTISFSGFYARRARRILPAALTVLIVCLVATFAVSSPVFWADQLRHLIASTLFVENWALAAQSVDYLGSSAAATPVQHYWSLSVEEQFYLVWPALIVALFWLTGRLIARRRFSALTVGLAIVVGASLVYSIVTSVTDPAPAFFNTAARAWQFGAGALLACVGVSTSDRRALRLGAGFAGWALIAASLLVLDDSFAYPGVAAIGPVLGTALVIWAGVAPRSPFVAQLFDNGAVRWLAELSFSAYLWHWPLIVFARQLLGDDLSHATRVVILATTFALAFATTVFIERPIRSGRLARKPARLTAVFATALTIAVVAAATISLVTFEKSVADQVAAASAGGVCVGAEVRDPARVCTDGPYASLTPNPLSSYDQISVLHDMGCAVEPKDVGLKSCAFGDANSDVTVALVGDSHAMRMWPAIKRLAEENGWHLVTFLRSACMYTLAPSSSDVCDDWRKNVAERLDEEGPWDLVFTAATAGLSNPDSAATGLHEAWTRLTDAGAQVVVIADNPKLPTSPRACIADNLDDLSACDVPRSEVNLSDIQVAAAQNRDGVHIVDLTSFYCDATTCVVSAGGVLLYSDRAHLNEEYTVTLAPYIADQVAVFEPRLFELHG